MIKIKFCGLTQPCDIETANALHADYIGFVFSPRSRRYLTPKKAAELKEQLAPSILAVGVFVDEELEKVAALLNQKIINVAQLHGQEDATYIKRLKILTGMPVIKAFSMYTEREKKLAQNCIADYVLLDSGSGGTGKVFDWDLVRDMNRPYFLAGGLNLENIEKAAGTLHPFGVDVSSGIETNGRKDPAKMAAFAAAIRKLERK